MTRQDRQLLKELKKALPLLIKDLAREKKLKKKDFMLYGVRDALFFDCLLNVSVNNENQCVCSSIERVKPLWLDDLLWDFLGMSDNKKAPASLRATGAFAVYGAPILEDSTILENWSLDELKNALIKYTDQFCEDIMNVPYSVFEESILNGYHGELREALYYIHEGKYRMALETIGECEGAFSNGGIDINDAMRNYCLKSN